MEDPSLSLARGASGSALANVGPEGPKNRVRPAVLFCLEPLSSAEGEFEGAPPGLTLGERRCEMHAPMHRRLIGALTISGLALAGLVISSDAAAAEEARWEDPTKPAPAVRRSGFAAGISSGLSLGRAWGYPNEAEKIDRRQFLADTKLGWSFGGTLWLGGALTDWFTFGFGLLQAGLSGHGLTAGGGAYVIHLETFPFFYSGKQGQNFGLLANFGAGSVVIMREKESRANGGNMGVIGLGAFWEPLRFWHFSAGPLLEGTYLFSSSAHFLSLTAGMRLVFYGGP